MTRTRTAALLAPAFFALFLLAGGRVACAQDQYQSQDPTKSADTDAEWRPIDVRREIREHFTQMPYGWWIREPELHLNSYEVEVHIPDWWRGNPTSAVNGLCPERRSRIWKVAKSLTLRPFYLKRPWPGVECFR